jgi:excisionase family DNA binding protein
MKKNKRITNKSLDNSNLPLGLKVDQVAELIGISRATAYKLVQEDDFPKIKLGKRIIIPTNFFIEWLNNRKNKGDKYD